MEIRRAFTSFQLMTILEENHHSFLIVEHDPMLYEDAKEMVEYVAQALKQTSREATILLYSPALDPRLQKMVEPFAQIAREPSAPSRRRIGPKKLKNGLMLSFSYDT